MGILLGAVLISAGIFLVVRGRVCSRWLARHDEWLMLADSATWHENLLIVGGLSIVAGLAFCVLF